MVRNGKNPLTQIVNRLEDNMKREFFYVNDRSNEPVLINTVYPFNYYVYKKHSVRLLLLIMIISLYHLFIICNTL